MKQTIITTIIILFAIMLTAVVSATVVQQNNFYYGIIGNDGSLTTTIIPITNVNAVGFTCSNADCSATSGSLWNGQVLNSGNSSRLDLVYPTILQDNGYGIFFYKTGYIPYEVKATWAGSGEASAGNRYLTRKQSCWTNITGLSASYADGKLTITANLNSPLGNAGPLNYTPESLVSEYSVNVQVKLNVTGANNYESIQNISLKFSEVKPVSFQFQTGSGNYSLTLITNSQDAKCLNSAERTSTVIYTVAGNVPNPGNNEGSHGGTSTNDKKKKEKKQLIFEEEEKTEDDIEVTSASTNDLVGTSDAIVLKAAENETSFSWIFYFLGILSLVLLVLIIILILMRN